MDLFLKKEYLLHWSRFVQTSTIASNFCGHGMKEELTFSQMQDVQAIFNFYLTAFVSHNVEIPEDYKNFVTFTPPSVVIPQNSDLSEEFELYVHDACPLMPPELDAIAEAIEGKPNLTDELTMYFTKTSNNNNTMEIILDWPNINEKGWVTSNITPHRISSNNNDFLLCILKKNNIPTPKQSEPNSSKDDEV